MCKLGTKYFEISVYGKNKINKNNKTSGCQVGRLRTIFQDFPLYFQYSLQQTLPFPNVAITMIVPVNN